MQPLDIWQAIGSAQVAEITAVMSTAISLILTAQGQRQRKIARNGNSQKKCRKTLDKCLKVGYYPLPNFSIH